MPELIVTVSPAIGNGKPPQVAVLFQSPLTLAVLAAASAVFAVSMSIAKIAHAQEASPIRLEADFRKLNFAGITCRHHGITAPSLFRHCTRKEAESQGKHG
ncbi:MAG TPA: hypothetical protein DET40_12940 [Lentisphaeria bacterium]|nr:MAG: hypothetical protein A2X45_19105 [Lentisphaerae bacterium GWF2_50_93]HCE44447.1 hypothetical protein [Lentisphaeria bacterium]